MDNCIHANDLGFILNAAGLLVAALSFGDPGKEIKGLQNFVAFIKRPRIFAAGLVVIVCSVILLIVGASNPGACLSPRTVTSDAFLSGKKRALCEVLRLEIPGSGGSSHSLSVWVMNFCLIFLIALAVLLGRIVMTEGIRREIRILTGLACAALLLTAPYLLAARLTWTAAYRAAIDGSVTARTFSFENYGGNGEVLNAALKRLFPVGATKPYIDQIFSEKNGVTQSIPRPDVTSYLYRTSSITSCLFSDRMPPSAWQVNVSYSPDLKLKALSLAPVLDLSP